jgi:hypothetical protein
MFGLLEHYVKGFREICDAATEVSPNLTADASRAPTARGARLGCGLPDHRDCFQSSITTDKPLVPPTPRAG